MTPKRPRLFYGNSVATYNLGLCNLSYSPQTHERSTDYDIDLLQSGTSILTKWSYFFNYSSSCFWSEFPCLIVSCRASYWQFIADLLRGYKLPDCLGPFKFKKVLSVEILQRKSTLFNTIQGTFWFFGQMSSGCHITSNVFHLIRADGYKKLLHEFIKKTVYRVSAMESPERRQTTGEKADLESDMTLNYHEESQ